MPSIYFKYDNNIYKFVNYSVSKTDGSLYLSLLRDGRSDAHILSSYDPSDGTFRSEFGEVSTDRRKTKKISYHPTGFINYHDIKTNRIIGEPLGSITQPFNFLSYSIPTIERLDLYNQSISEEDSIIEFDTYNGQRITFNFVVAPWNYSFKAKEPLFSINYYRFMSINVFIEEVTVPQELVNHFTYLTPSMGLYENKLLNEDQALISFHQLLNQTKGLILYSPNGEGFYKLVFTVPMRVPPRLEIELDDKSLSVVEDSESKSTSSIRFKIVDKKNKTIKSVVSINSISLDAEIY